ncbi:MAG: hypothetical protein U0V70_07160 [Terriglobia bacterium]
MSWKLKAFSWGSFLTLAVTINIILAQTSGSTSKTEKLAKVTIEGELGVLRDPFGSRSKNEPPQLTVKVSKAMAGDGKNLGGMEGRILRLIRTSKNEGLLSKYNKGDKVIMVGELDDEKDTLEPESIKAAVPKGSDSKEPAGSN